MLFEYQARIKWRWAFFAAALFVFGGTLTAAQSSDDDVDPIAMFERGQNAHARGELERALEFYDRAIELKPEFPEAEYQRAVALISLGRHSESELSLRRAIALRPEWASPFALLGDMLVRQRRAKDAEAPLTRALELEPNNPIALVALADLRLQTKATAGVLRNLLVDLKRASSAPDATSNLWVAIGSVERGLGDTKSALASTDRALAVDSRNIDAHMLRAAILESMGETSLAIESAKAVKQIAPNSILVSTTLARLYLQARNCAEATRTLDELDTASKRPSETKSLRSVIALECASGSEELSLLEAALLKEPRNAEILVRLCALYRKDDPQRAVEYCRRALEIEPGNVDYGTSYGAALVQMKRFADAASVLQRVIAVAPDRFTAHANLAIALYQLNRFREALAEYKWIVEAKPEATAAYFFIAVTYDKLEEFKDALAAYEVFLARADPNQFQLEIDKVNLRLPPLRNQIKRGQGAKKKS